jgi:glycosyltransferase involved in cell wall biosynthesis
MRILYSAIDQVVPGTTGGSVHVAAVAAGLAALGHEVHVLVTQGTGAFPPGAVRWIGMSPPFGASQLRWTRTGAVTRIARQLGPDVIIERYHNFGGEAILQARQLGAVAVLEVNAPVIDHHGSTKALLDRALLVRPLQRWRERLCAAADVIVTPTAGILPEGTDPARVLELEWGADTEQFRPAAAGGLPFVPPSGTIAVFAGAFRSWHGAIHLARAMRRLRERGRRDISALFVGDGPELPAVRTEAANLDQVVFTGAIPHDRMPAVLAASHIGVAPFDLATHKPLSLGFYWSPLKIFEYMATGLPVVAPAVARIPALVEHGREGVLYDPSEAAALEGALEQLTDEALRNRLGAAARDRAVREYSWKAHCEALSASFEARRPPVRAQ